LIIDWLIEDGFITESITNGRNHKLTTNKGITRLVCLKIPRTRVCAVQAALWHYLRKIRAIIKNGSYFLLQTTILELKLIFNDVRKYNSVK